MSSINYFNQFYASQNQEFSVVIEDNSSVAYAYLLKNNDIISELWLYNRGKTLYDNWNELNENDLPPQNLDCFIEKNIKPIFSDNDIDVKWVFNNLKKVKVYIYIRNELIGYLDSKKTIGFSKLVLQDTPIAKQYD